ncbi:MAG: acyl carrier protein [Eggerthellaceae bacterium]|jgi:acyl carrier protein|nr:acyl carrier protein [Eggerthellaceae bacterium]
MDDLLELVRTRLSENLGLDPASIQPESTFEELDIDSLDMVELSSDLENELDITLARPGDISTIGEYLDYVNSRR